MRLILRYESSDGCTYSCTNVLPIEYASAEDLIVDFELLIRKTSMMGGHELLFFGHSFYIGDFLTAGQYQDPDIMTVDDWFAEGK